MRGWRAAHASPPPRTAATKTYARSRKTTASDGIRPGPWRLDASGEFQRLLATVSPHRQRHEEQRVAGEPGEAGRERLGGGADGAPRELAVVVGRQVRGDPPHEVGKLAERHEPAPRRRPRQGA